MIPTHYHYNCSGNLERSTTEQVLDCLAKTGDWILKKIDIFETDKTEKYGQSKVTHIFAKPIKTGEKMIIERYLYEGAKYNKKYTLTDKEAEFFSERFKYWKVKNAK